DAARAGARLTEALVQVAAEHARDREVPESIVVAALSSALGCVAAAIARNNGYDLTDFQAFVANHFARVFQAESARPVYHLRAARAESPGTGSLTAYCVVVRTRPLRGRRG